MVWKHCLQFDSFLRKKRQKCLCLLLAVLLTLELLGGCEWGDGEKLLLNEVMTKNTSFLTDSQGQTPDWVELYNAGRQDISLKGWYLSDEELNPMKYSFPDIIVPAGGYRLVLCDGEDRYEGASDELHANFSLSSQGESVFLTNPRGKMSRVEVGESLQNISRGRVPEGKEAGEYRWFAKPTPGKPNTGAYSDSIADLMLRYEPELRIVDYCSANTVTLPLDADGACCGFVTVKNITDEPLTLSDYSLSDSAGNPDKWRFPKGLTLGAGETLRVVCSGQNGIKKDGTVHSSFRLTAGDDALLLGLGGRAVQTLPLGDSYEGIYAVVSEKDGSVGYARLADESGTVYDDPLEAALVRHMSVVISEVSAVKGNGAEEPYDWIELYNPSETDVSLKGWKLSDDGSPSQSCALPDITLPAGGYQLIYCDKNPQKQKYSVYAGFNLSRAGETLYLTDSRGVTVDALAVGKLRTGVTAGRDKNGTAERVYYTHATPGKENDAAWYRGYVSKPCLSEEGGYVAGGTKIRLLNAESGAAYRFTTDGSVPTEESPEFKGITVSENTVLRVKAFREDKLPSDVTTATFLTENAASRTLPVVCIASAPEGLFSEKSGIFAMGTQHAAEFPYKGANFWQNWEREANFEYYVDGRKAVDVPAGIKVFGQYSRAYAQKSFALYFRGDYGVRSVTYPFFAGSDHVTFESLVLRAGGQDQNGTRIRDAYASQALKGYTSLVYQEWQPTAVYLNGEYWGYYDLREKITADWLGRYAGVDGENVDLIKGNKEAKAGTNEAYLDLVHYAGTHDLSQEEYYRYVADRMDIDNFIDYLAAEIFFCNGDSGNIKFYCDRGEGGKWRWIVFDFDMTLRNEALWPDYNMFQRQFDPAGHGANHGFSTVLRRSLLRNPEFRWRFAERFAALLNTAFQPEHMTEVLDGMLAQIDGEMPRHCQRWHEPASYEKWRNEAERLRGVAQGRRALCKKQLIEFLGLSDSEVHTLFPED